MPRMHPGRCCAPRFVYVLAAACCDATSMRLIGLFQSALGLLGRHHSWPSAVL